MGKNKIMLEIFGFDEMIKQLENVGADAKGFVEDSLSSVAEDVGVQTLEAIGKANLPAGGKYSKGDTAKSVIQNPNVEWVGLCASVGVGFDKTVPGAGGFLISGTPRMKPVQGLVSIYKRKTFSKELTDGLADSFQDYLQDALGG